MDTSTKIAINKDLILREKLAIQRSILANQNTLLAFLRTAMYFLVAGLSVGNLLTVKYATLIEWSLYVVSCILFIVGWINFRIQHKKIEESKTHIGNYKMEYLDKS